MHPLTGLAVFAVLAFLLPALVVLGFACVTGTLTRHVARLGRRLGGRRAPAATSEEPMPVVLHELELTRLAAEVQRMRRSRRPGLAVQVAACTAAYDDRLVRCARGMGLPAPTTVPPLHPAERLDLETRLVAAGVEW